jgi:putative modified peptide
MQTTSVASTTAVTARAKPRSAPLDPQIADRLLDLLSTDDAFRRLFKRNPGKALDQIGFLAGSAVLSPSFCFFGIQKLASKRQIIEVRAEIRAMLLSGLSQNPIQLDVGAAVRNLQK